MSITIHGVTHAPIATLDPRRVVAFGLEHRQVQHGAKILIEHRKVNSQWWDLANGQGFHSQQHWDLLLKEGKIL